MKTKHVMLVELNSTKLQLTATRHELANAKTVLTDTKAALADIESKLTYTNNQLTDILKRISTLKVLLYLATNKAVAKPNSSTVVLESSLSWFNKLVTVVKMSESGDQQCPVILNLPQFSIKREKTMNGSVTHFTLTAKDTRCVSVLMQLGTEVVEATTWLCICAL